MYWNYRVLKYKDHGEIIYGIVEAYYDEGEKLSWTEPIEVIGDSVDELKTTLQWMLLALDKPVIEDDSLTKSE